MHADPTENVTQTIASEAVPTAPHASVAAGGQVDPPRFRPVSVKHLVRSAKMCGYWNSANCFTEEQ